MASTAIAATRGDAHRRRQRAQAASFRLPRRQPSRGPKGTSTIRATKMRREGEREIGRADRDLGAGDGIERQRIERADEHRGAGRDEEDIVEQQRGVLAHRLERGPAFQLGRAPGEQRQRPADGEHQHAQDIDAAFGIVGEGMHRGEHARAHQEGADQAKRKAADGQQQRPGAKGAGAFGRQRRMQQRGAPEATASGRRSPPGPRTRSRPSPVRNRPTSCPA